MLQNISRQFSLARVEGSISTTTPRLGLITYFLSLDIDVTSAKSYRHQSKQSSIVQLTSSTRLTAKIAAKNSTAQLLLMCKSGFFRTFALILYDSGTSTLSVAWRRISPLHTRKRVGNKKLADIYSAPWMIQTKDLFLNYVIAISSNRLLKYWVLLPKVLKQYKNLKVSICTICGLPTNFVKMRTQNVMTRTIPRRSCKQFWVALHHKLLSKHSHSPTNPKAQSPWSISITVYKLQVREHLIKDSYCSPRSVSATCMFASIVSHSLWGTIDANVDWVYNNKKSFAHTVETAYLRYFYYRDFLYTTESA